MQRAAVSSDEITGTLLASFKAAQGKATPYKHWIVGHCLPDAVMASILALPFEAPALDGTSGKRELHNNTRTYFDAGTMAAHPVCKAFNTAFMDPRVTGAIERTFGSRLGGSYLRTEFAQDTDGFWLEPHTDLGVKLFTMLLYLSTDPRHGELGTDIYDTEKRHTGRSPFISNAAMIFVPSAITYHGFEPRKIEGVRKSVIINYVTTEWRAREQLAFPDRSVVSTVA